MLLCVNTHLSKWLTTEDWLSPASAGLFWGAILTPAKQQVTHFSAVTRKVKGQCTVVPIIMPHIVVQTAFYHKNKECDPQWVLAKMKPN